MRSLEVTLVNPPHQAHPVGDEKEIAPPLGLLRLAEALIRAGHVPRIEDLNLAWHVDAKLRGDFYGRAAELILSGSPDVIGFTSMAVDTHVALLLAAQIKARAPETVVVMGGPHGGLLSREIRDRWPSVDLVIRGVGSGALADAVNLLSTFERGPRRVAAARAYARPPSMSEETSRWDFRSAYSLIQWADYFRTTGRRHANAEAGRGCRYRCSFCYSPAHHAGWTVAPIDSVLEELEYLNGIGVNDVFFVDDNFLNAPDWSVETAAAIGTAFPQLNWSCYATLPALSESVLEALGAGGCRAIFSGVDAITPISRRAYHKSFAREVATVAKVLAQAQASNIVPTFAFLVAPPSHPTGVEFDATVTAAAALQTLDLDGVRVRLNALAFYPGTTIEVTGLQFTADSSRADLLLDVTDEARENPLAAAAPQLFPFHNRYVEADEWDQFVSRVFVLYSLVDSRPQSLLDIQGAHGWPPSRVADWLLQELPPLCSIPKDSRRNIVVKLFDSTFHVPVAQSISQN